MWTTRSFTPCACLLAIGKPSFADYKEKVIDLLARVTTVSVRTVEITNAMRAAAR